MNKEKSNYDIASEAIAHLYLYPSYADVELGERFARIVEKAKDIDWDYRNDVIVIDGGNISLVLRTVLSILTMMNL